MCRGWVRGVCLVSHRFNRLAEPAVVPQHPLHIEHTPAPPSRPTHRPPLACTPFPMPLPHHLTCYPPCRFISCAHHCTASSPSATTTPVACHAAHSPPAPAHCPRWAPHSSMSACAPAAARRRQHRCRCHARWSAAAAAGALTAVTTRWPTQQQQHHHHHRAVSAPRRGSRAGGTRCRPRRPSAVMCDRRRSSALTWTAAGGAARGVCRSSPRRPIALRAALTWRLRRRAKPVVVAAAGELIRCRAAGCGPRAWVCCWRPR